MSKKKSVKEVVKTRKPVFMTEVWGDNHTGGWSIICNDGSIWTKCYGVESNWERIVDVPQEDRE